MAMPASRFRAQPAVSPPSASQVTFELPVTPSQPRNPLPLEGKMELLICFVATLFIFLLIFRK
ncbi:hypothetical protein [Caballeronia fortuita]|uniref:hypothetical protein n=1 Tax=Caballeronia fortuita TaxID=1777138 RepID=UPI000772CE2F|nr:hypothetical protein [Caballeronia fortuita]